MSSRALGPAVAGSWYPADSATLAREVDRLLASATKDAVATPRGPLLAVIEPHAGYMYSGQVAAQGFRLVRPQEASLVILLGPSHYAGFRGATIPDADSYRTPLGEVPLDRDALKELARWPGFRVDNDPYGREHSLEAEIPFLQRRLDPGWRAVPILVGSGSVGADAQQVAEGLAPLVAEGAILVVSSDFTHFGPRFGYVPFREDVPRKIRELDMGAIRHIEAGDLAGFEAYLEETDATVCGRDAIDVLLRILGGGAVGTLVAYDTSGRITGDWEHSVSYAALAFHARAGTP